MKDIEKYVIESHKAIAGLTEKVNTIATHVEKTAVTVNNIEKINIQQNGSIKRNTTKIDNHVQRHREKEKNLKWLAGIIFTIAGLVLASIKAF